MGLLEGCWFLISFLIIGVVLLVDPKNSIPTSNSNSMLGFFSSPSSGQQWLYRFSALLIANFFILTIILSIT